MNINGINLNAGGMTDMITNHISFLTFFLEMFATIKKEMWKIVMETDEVQSKCIVCSS
jgi:hypothetical protein